METGYSDGSTNRRSRVNLLGEKLELTGISVAYALEKGCRHLLIMDLVRCGEVFCDQRIITMKTDLAEVGSLLSAVYVTFIKSLWS